MDKNVCINCDYNKMWGGNCEYEQEEKCIYATARYLTRDERNKIEKKLIIMRYILDDIIDIDEENTMEDLTNSLLDILCDMEYEIKYRIRDFEYMQKDKNEAEQLFGLLVYP